MARHVLGLFSRHSFGFVILVVNFEKHDVPTHTRETSSRMCNYSKKINNSSLETFPYVQNKIPICFIAHAVKEKKKKSLNI